MQSLGQANVPLIVL